MNAAKFVAKWSRVELSEPAASQQHFLDLCQLVGQRPPAEVDPIGDVFTFEKGVGVTGPASAGTKGDRGFADVWWKGKFGWEYKRKGKYKDLAEAYRQLCQYREALAEAERGKGLALSRVPMTGALRGVSPEAERLPSPTDSNI